MIRRRATVAAICLFVAASAAAAQGTPTDLRGHWAEGRIGTLLGRGIVELYADGRFRPEEPISRARFARWLVAARGLPLERPQLPTFRDVTRADWFFPYAETAAAHGILDGDNNRGTASFFRPTELLTREEAIHWTVRAMGYGWEAERLAAVYLPVVDAADVTASRRGSVAVALLARPPLLREPTTDRVRARAPMTRAEGASLVWAYLQAVKTGIRLQTEEHIEPGLRLVTEKRGVLRTPPVWRVQIGAFASEENARRLADQMRSRGLPTFVDFLDGLHKVRVGSFATRQAAETLRARLAEEGLPTWLISTLRDFEALPGPHRVAVLQVQPDAAALVPALAGERVIGRERTSAIATRRGAVAAVNGGFFAPDGDPIGGLAIDGEWISEPIPHRSCVGIGEYGGLLFDVLGWRGEVSTPYGLLALSGINRARRADETILYTPRYDATTRTNFAGIEVVVGGGVVQQVRVGAGNSTIPADGFVLSGHGAARAALSVLQPGDPVGVTISVLPASADPRWQQVRHAVCGGPRLLSAGQVIATGEGFTAWFLNRRHPRTAIGRTPDGTIILLVADGRSPYHALGMTAAELALELRRWGAADAVNLDGGGSSTMVVRGRLVNLPSDETGERPVGDALLVLRR
ncbi:MAG: phosphodiester glycosidase family protein [Armatimonadota bacterium]|nr:phosphodiester glycosidase family protein [Armatimonadota bacterium]